MSFAAERYAAQKRNLLLQYWENESVKDPRRWDSRQQADIVEKIAKNTYWNINLWSGNDMDF